MAEKNSNTKTEHIVAIEAALKSGKAWAQRFIELARKNPNDYALRGRISDAEHHFKGKPDELADFYMTIQGACVIAKTPSDALPEHPNPYFGDTNKPFEALFRLMAGQKRGEVARYANFELERLQAISNHARDVKGQIFSGLQGIGHALAIAAETGELDRSQIGGIGRFLSNLGELAEACDRLGLEADYAQSLRGTL